MGMTCLCSVNDIEEGYRLGQLGLALQEKFQLRVWLPRVAGIYWLGIHTFKHPLATIITPLKRAQRVGIETGGIEFALACGVAHVWARFETSPLPEVEAAYKVLREQIIFYGLKNILSMTKPVLQAIHNLMDRGSVGPPTTLSGEIMDESSLHEMKESNGKLFEFAHFHLMMLAYLFGEYVEATEYSKLLRPASDLPFGAIDAALIVLFDALIALQNARRAQKRNRLRHARKQLRRIRYWAQHAPHLFLCRQYLLEAEIAAVSGDHASVYSKYVAAIAQATYSGFIFQIALGNELAGKYYLLERKDEETAMPFLREALHHYDRWGAKAKVEHLALELRLPLSS
jgi:hypothetical protein